MMSNRYFLIGLGVFLALFVWPMLSGALLARKGGTAARKA